MAQKKSASSNKTTVRRIKATDEATKKPVKKALAKPKTTTKDKVMPEESVKTRNPLKAFGRYVKGAWFELKQVRWPNRSATWSMTAAVLVFTAFFIGLIMLLDAGFQWLFEQILK
ncbi:preprotein translocase subunit SecE [Candidatus Saccharibacteria bacterium 32-49-10]|nr:MAG: preprotein translocase subunit SecE [Candidatus Saccharibacteria bacterium 32-49-10]